MFKSIIGGLARGMGRMGGETLREVPRAIEKTAAVPKLMAEKPPVSQVLMANVLSIESKAQKGGRGAARNGLQEISDGTLTKNASSENAEEEEAAQDLSKREFADPFAGLPETPPQPSHPGSEFHIVSKTLEEVPEALGGSPKDVVAESPQGR